MADASPAVGDAPSQNPDEQITSGVFADEDEEENHELIQPAKKKVRPALC